LKRKRDREIKREREGGEERGERKRGEREKEERERKGGEREGERETLLSIIYI
jgi:hypothetical protein